ncbi:MAG TPA: vWA domain-containing protein, partial [Lacipirellula sp.]
MIALAKLESPPSLMTEIRWNWDWSAGTTVLLAAAVVAWIVTVYAKEQAFVGARMRMVLAALRLVAAAAVIVMLGQPTVERSRVVPPRVAVLVDESASMDTQDVPAAELPQASGATGAITRREAWESLLTGGESPVMAAIRDQFQVDVVRFAGAPELASDDDALRTTAKLAPDRDATRLGDAIDFALRDMPGPRPAAVIAMTDGVNTGGMPLDVAADRARILGVPLHTVAIGSDAPRPDVAIE